MNRPKPGPLDGVRVLELAQVMAIPTCGLLLADMGADVVKIEPPHGDSFRLHQRPRARAEGKGYAIFNRGKRSLCLDLTRPESRGVLDRLVAGADVVLVSFKPSDLPRYGVDYERLVGVKPDLVYLENTPYGPAGPFSRDGGYDVVVQGMSGIGAITSAPLEDGDAPRFVRPAYADMGTGFLSALAVVAALHHREKTGEGQRMHTSLLSTAITLGANVLSRFEQVDREPVDHFAGELSALRESGAGFAAQQALWRRLLQAQGHGNVYFRHYRTSDGFLSVGCLTPNLNERFRKVTGLADPRQESVFDASSTEGWDALTLFVREAEDLMRTRTTDAWIERLRAGGVPCGPFNFPHEVFDDAQVNANGYFVELEHPELGPYRTFAPPIRMEASPLRATAAAPPLDGHTDELLAEAGFDPDEVARLRESGIVGTRRA